MQRAVVIGGSLGGMSAARVLADAFDEVVLVERDELPEAVQPRAGLPQSRHVHVLLQRGRDQLEQLFPGFIAAMHQAGARSFDPGSNIATRRRPGWQDVGPLGFEMLYASRDLLEASVRRLLRTQTKVQLRDRTQVLGLRMTPARRIDGVRVRDKESQQEATLAADLVVDASGRATRSEAWLRELGVQPPRCDRVDVHAGYATRLYEAPAEPPESWWWRGVWLEWEAPSLPRGGVIFPIEGNRWVVTLAGIRDDIPPTDEAGFNAFMRTLSSPLLAQAVARATPISGITGNRSFANVFRRYDKWKQPISGFIAIGDACCAFNPIYGQGMSAAAVSSGLLGSLLRELGPRHAQLERRFFMRQAKFLRGPWALATGADFAWPTTDGERPPSIPLLPSYMRLLFESTHCNAALRRHIAPLFNLTGTHALLFEPAFAAKVLLCASRRRLRGRRSVPELPPVPAEAARQSASL